jgi:alkanesulfonate monooxygenase SsuD/methylene tetrahydromethanopterin reductase-like flavin-dependent oxidoreductase (luciferase family)
VVPIVSSVVQGKAIDLGIAIIPGTGLLELNREIVRVADEAGLAFVGVQDHPYQRHFVDTWSLIPTLLAETKQISFFTDVANLPLRPPAVMAKAAATLDVLSGGRFKLGLGGGANPDLIGHFGGPRRTPAETVDAVNEALPTAVGRGAGRRPEADHRADQERHAVPHHGKGCRYSPELDIPRNGL